MSTRVVFDFGAVLFDWQPARLIQQHLQPRSLAEQQAWQAAVFQGFGGDWGAFDLGRLPADSLAARIAERTGLLEPALQALIAAVPEALQPHPAVLSLLLQLRARGRPLSYLSNMPVPYAARLEQRHPLSQWFESGLFSGRMGLSKPDPAFFAQAERCFGSAAADCLLIDDHPGNVQAALACGWQALLFEDAPRLREALRQRRLLD